MKATLSSISLARVVMMKVMMRATLSFINPKSAFRIPHSGAPRGFRSRYCSFGLCFVFRRARLVLRFRLRHVARRGVAELLQYLGRQRTVYAVALADVSAARAAEAFVERDDCVRVPAVDVYNFAL